MDINMPTNVSHIAVIRSILLLKNAPTQLKEIYISVLILRLSLATLKDDHILSALKDLNALSSLPTTLASMDAKVTRATAINTVIRATLPDHTVTLAITVSALLSALRCPKEHPSISILTISSAQRDLSSHSALKDHPTISNVLRDQS